jgi:UDP-glucose 6-dehydrogenase
MVSYLLVRHLERRNGSVRNIAVIGVGYVGLVTGACFADLGNRVTCMDINAEKIEGLKQGIMPFYEPGLEELVERNVRAGRLLFATSYAEAIRDAEFVFIAVGTPEGVGYQPQLLQAVMSINAYQRRLVVKKLRDALGSLDGAVVGLLARRGRNGPPRPPYTLAEGCDAIMVVTDWNEFKNLDLERIRDRMRRPVLVDGRNIYDPAFVRSLGFVYRGIGRGFNGEGVQR